MPIACSSPVALQPYASGIIADRVSVSFSPDSDVSSIFDFDAKLTALPIALQQMGATYTRASVKNVVQDGALVQLASGQFGTSYDSVTGKYGYVPEPAATNLATYSDGGVSAYTNRGNVSDGTAVPGFTNGIAFGSNSVDRYAYKPITTTAGTAYTISVFVIMDDGGAPNVGTSQSSGDFSLVVDAFPITNAADLKTQLIGNGVYRVSGSIGSVVGGVSRNCGVVKYSTQSNRTFRFTGCQVETGSRSTSYIATAGSTATRSADVLSVPVANIPGFNSAAYTLFADFRMDTTAAVSGGIVWLGDVGATNFASLTLNSGGNGCTQINSGGANYQFLNSDAASVNRRKNSLSATTNNALAAFSGVGQTADTSVTMPLIPTVVYVGNGSSGGACLNGYIFRAGIIPQALSQAQINGLTA